jgi:DNA (cytosine-5)-methyltransferase 1
LHDALRSRGYRVGAVVLDAVRWVPQSRPRVFVIAVKKDIPIPAELIASEPNWMHTKAVLNAAKGLDDWVWWNMPIPPERNKNLMDIIEWDAPCDDFEKAARNLSLIPSRHWEKLDGNEIFAAPGYKRTRANKQVLELRFDGVAGCLRTPKGGSSRQFLILKRGDKVSSRLLTVRETARLMGAPETYKLPGTYNDGYKAMGDAVAVPVARYLAQYLLHPIWRSF